MSTASETMAWSICDSGRSSIEYSSHAKSQCSSSRAISSFENVRPGINPRFLSQNRAQKEPEKKMPSTHAKATRRCAKGASAPILERPLRLLAHRRHLPNRAEQPLRSSRSLMYVSMSRVRLRVHILHGDLEAVEAARLGRRNLGAEALRQVLHHDPIRGRKEGQHVRDEVALIISETLLPVVEV